MVSIKENTYRYNVIMFGQKETLKYSVKEDKCCIKHYNYIKYEKLKVEGTLLILLSEERKKNHVVQVHGSGGSDVWYGTSLHLTWNSYPCFHFSI